MAAMAKQGVCESCGGQALICIQGYCRACHKNEFYTFEFCDTRTDGAWMELALGASRDDVLARYPGALLDELKSLHVQVVLDAIATIRARQEPAKK